MYTCVNNGCPDKDAATMECKPGYTGPLCALCNAGYFKSVRDCAPCKRVRIGLLVAFVLVTPVLIALLLFLARKYHRYLDRAAAFSRECCIYRRNKPNYKDVTVFFTFVFASPSQI
jgi:hypothetical protein